MLPNILLFFYFQYMCSKAEQNLFSRSSSTSGTDSSIRIRKTRAGCTERKWFISVSLAMIFTVLVASAGIYFGCELIFRFLQHITQKYFFEFQNPNEKVSQYKIIINVLLMVLNFCRYKTFVVFKSVTFENFQIFL